jgi:NAD(P)-dependent dehydrogenase (short-subunit alcohol dehydrogenase family)
METAATAGQFAGKSVLVTGGGSGIDLGCARRLANDGAAVTICGRDEDRLKAGVEAIGGTSRYVVADITDEASIAGAVATACVDGVLEVIVANAGATEALGPLALIDVEAFERDLRLNVIGTFLTIEHGAPALAAAGGGSIVAVSSIAAVTRCRVLDTHTPRARAFKPSTLYRDAVNRRYAITIDASGDATRQR